MSARGSAASRTRSARLQFWHAGLGCACCQTSGAHLSLDAADACHGRMLRERYHLNQQVRKRTPKVDLRPVARECTAYFALNCAGFSMFARFSGEKVSPASLLVRGSFSPENRANMENPAQFKAK